MTSLFSNESMHNDSTSDVSDMATNDEMLHLSLAIQAVTMAPKNVLRRTGFCHWCEAALNEKTDVKESLNPMVSGLFCDEDCRDDWEQEQRMKKIAGNA